MGNDRTDHPTPSLASAQMHTFTYLHRHGHPHALHTNVHTKVISNTCRNTQCNTQGEVVVVGKWLLASPIHLGLKQCVQAMGQTSIRKRVQPEAARVHGFLQPDALHGMSE